MVPSRGCSIAGPAIWATRARCLPEGCEGRTRRPWPPTRADARSAARTFRGADGRGFRGGKGANIGLSEFVNLRCSGKYMFPPFRASCSAGPPPGAFFFGLCVFTVFFSYVLFVFLIFCVFLFLLFPYFLVFVLIGSIGYMFS